MIHIQTLQSLQLLEYIPYLKVYSVEVSVKGFIHKEIVYLPENLFYHLTIKSIEPIKNEENSHDDYADPNITKNPLSIK